MVSRGNNTRSKHQNIDSDNELAVDNDKTQRNCAKANANDPELLNLVYKEIAEKLGLEIAMEIYSMFRGQQISFPVRFFNPDRIRQMIIEEYDGTNIRNLAIKYDYSEKTVRRIIKESLEE